MLTSAGGTFLSSRAGKLPSMEQRMVKISAWAVAGKPSSKTRCKSTVGATHFRVMDVMCEQVMCEP